MARYGTCQRRARWECTEGDCVSIGCLSQDGRESSSSSGAAGTDFGGRVNSGPEQPEPSTLSLTADRSSRDHIQQPTLPVFRLGQRPELNGLRAIAVIAVMIFHADEKLLRAGFIGVDFFFVISGFLITALLIEEYDRTKSISLKH